MTATENWIALEDSRGAARRQALVRVGVPLGVAALATGWTAAFADASTGAPFVGGMVALLAGTYTVLSARVARRAFERHHQVHVLPKILEDAGARLSCSPDATPSWVALHRAHLFPPAQQARPGPLLYGAVDGVFMEAGAVVLTTEKIIRKVRRVQKPVFSGAVYTADLGPGTVEGDMVILARGARWPRGARKGARWYRLPRQGLPVGTRVFGRVGAAGGLPADVMPFLTDVLRLHRRTRVSIQDTRHLVVAVPGRAALFKPASLFAPLARDARAARSLAAMRVVAALAGALGAPQVAVPEPVEVDPAVVPSPKEALARALSKGRAGPPRPDPRARMRALMERGQGYWAQAKAHPWTHQGRAVVGDVWRSLRGSAPATAASERTLEAWDDVRSRLGLGQAAPIPKVVRPAGDVASGVDQEDGLDGQGAPAVVQPAPPVEKD